MTLHKGVKANVSGSVVAGFPSPAEQYLEPPLDLNELLVKRPAATYFVRVQGDSMSGAGISDGDLLVVDRSLRPADGDVIIASVDGDFTVKTYRRRGLPRLRTPPPRQDTPLGGHSLRRGIRAHEDARQDRKPHREEAARGRVPHARRSDGDPRLPARGRGMGRGSPSAGQAPRRAHPDRTAPS